MVTPLRRSRLIAITMLWCLASGYSFAVETPTDDNLSIAAILSNERDEYQDVLHSFSKQLHKSSKQHIEITSLAINDFIHHKDDSYDLVVAIGTFASQTVVTYVQDTPILSIFIPKKNFTELQLKSTTSITATVIDQPLNRYLDLCTLVLGDKMKKLGIFYNGQKQLRDQLNKEITERHLTPVFETVNGPITARHITRLINSSDAILLLPGIADISPKRAKWLLYMAYRDRIPVIAFSETYVKSGALASISSSPDDIGRQAAEYIASLLAQPGPLTINQSDINQINYPKSFTVHVNRKIAEQLDMTIPDTEVLEKQIGKTANKDRKISANDD